MNTETKPTFKRFIDRITITINEQGNITGASQNVTQVNLNADGSRINNQDFGLHALNPKGLVNALPTELKLVAQITDLQVKIQVLSKRLSEDTEKVIPKGRISKTVLLARLIKEGSANFAIDTLKKDPVQYELWQATDYVNVNDPVVRQFLISIGGDLDILLAP